MTRCALLLVALLSVSSWLEGFAARIPQVPKSRRRTSTLGQYELFDYNPVADPAAVVISGNARFTVLTPQLIRMEWAPNGQFEDRATLAVVNRDLAPPAFNSSLNHGMLTIVTDDITLTYMTGQAFNSKNLMVMSNNADSPFTMWQPGMSNAGNLLGTIKSLDELNVIPLNCTQNAGTIVHDEVLHCEWAIISTQGWAVYDDSSNWALDDTYWWAEPTLDQIDWYFFGHGLNYKQAIADYVSIGGNTAMVPRAAVGIWWSIWYNVDNHDTMKIIEDYRSRSIPLDVYILDMDWHTKQGWGGYTVDTTLFPYPTDSFQAILDQGLIMGANLHDDDGVRTTEKMHDAMCTAIGESPANCGLIPFTVVNSSVAYALEDVVLKDVENDGMTFWWIDWQQGGTQGGAQGLKQNPTIWLDKIRGTDHIRRGEDVRGMVLSRWGGMGNHRYQVGFSGDVAELTWSNLAFQPYFSFTASNVLYGFWSHDVVGPPDDHELHLRWIQWASLSAIFRTHDRGMSAGSCWLTQTCGIVKIWDLPDPFFEAARTALQFRALLVPYIYTAYFQAFLTGISILRPMYYDYPALDMAYAGDQNGDYAQYMFGDDMLVAPVVSPVGNTSMATTSVWIPPGVWVELATGVLVQGGTNGMVLTKSYDIREIPVFVQAGAVIPYLPVPTNGNPIGVAGQQYTNLGFCVYPGQQSGSTALYEDDGVSVSGYTGSEYVWTSASYTRSPTNDYLAFTVSSTGNYPLFPQSRAIELRVVNSMPALKVVVGSESLPYARWGGPNTWHYDGVTMELVVNVNNADTSSPFTIEVYTLEVVDSQMSGIRGGLYHATLSKNNLDHTRSTPGSNTPTGGNLDTVASMGDAFSYLAGTDLDAFQGLLEGFPAAFAAAVTEVQGLNGQVNGAELAYSVELLATAFN